MEPRAIERVVDKYLQEAGITGASVHTLRHTFATHQPGGGFPLHVVDPGDHPRHRAPFANHDDLDAARDRAARLLGLNLGRRLVAVLHDDCAALGRPVDGAALEGADPPASLGTIALVAGGISEKAGLPAHALPFVPNLTMDFMGARVGRPVDRAPFEVVEATDAIRGPLLVREGKPKEPTLTAELRPFDPDQAMDFVRPGIQRPVNGTALEITDATTAGGRIHLGATDAFVDRMPPTAIWPTELGVLVIDGRHGVLALWWRLHH